MALVQVTALKDFRATALSTTDVTTGYNLGALTSGQYLYGGLHLTFPSTARTLVMTIQSATASGFGSPSTQLTFTLSTGTDAQWATPVTNLSTEHAWWRARWVLSTASSTGGTWKGLVWMGFK